MTGRRLGSDAREASFLAKDYDRRHDEHGETDVIFGCGIMVNIASGIRPDLRYWPESAAGSEVRSPPAEERDQRDRLHHPVRKSHRCQIP